MNLSISLKDTATPDILAIPGLISSEGSMKSGGRALRSAIIANLNAKPPNSRFPGATTRFWERAAKSVTQPMIAGASATVSITQIGVRYNYFGGTIRAPWKNGSTATYLTIPATEEAYGHRAREFSDLTVAFLGRSPSGAPILALVKGMPRQSSRPTKPRVARSVETSASRKQSESAIKPKDRLNVIYWLVTESTKQPDPTVLPPEQDMKLAFTKGVRSYVRGRLRQSKSALPENNE